MGLCYNVYDLYRYTSERERTVQEKGQKTITELKGQVNEILLRIRAEAKNLAEDFGTHTYSQEEIESIIKERTREIPELQGITACYEPYAFSADRRLFCPYYNNGTDRYVYVGDSYDYTDKDRKGTEWYNEVVQDGAEWVEPYYAEAAKDWYIDYGIPFYYTEGPKKGEVRGTITMSFVASGFKSIVLSLSLGKTGYGIVTSEKGNFLSHPIDDYIGTTNLETVKSSETQPELIEAYTGMQQGDKGSVAFRENQDGAEVLFFYDTIDVSGWAIGLLFYKNELLGDIAGHNRRYIRLGLILSAFLLIIIAIYFNKDYLDFREIWQLSILASILLIGNIFFVWYLEHNRSLAREKLSPPITDRTALSNFIDQQHQRLEKLKLRKSTPVPTGLLIRRMEFENSYELNVSGTVWQKYPLEIADRVSVGFSLPQTSPFAEASYIEEVYRKRVEPTEKKPGHLLVRYEFRTTLEQYLDYKDFPFDKRHLKVHIAPLQITDQLLFTPDLSGYEFTNPVRRPGLDPDVHISGNRVTKSYFSYIVKSYSTNFGYTSKTLFEEVPALWFNVNLRRTLINVFVTYLIPIFVTLTMVFILLVASSKGEERQGIIESMAAFFFVLIFSHIDMRREIITPDLIFLEYFYFITYILIVLTTANLITYAKNRTQVFDFNENQIFKASYFPFFFLCILIVSLAKFY